MTPKSDTYQPRLRVRKLVSCGIAPSGSTRCAQSLYALLLMLVGLSSTASAHQDDFESPDCQWKLVHSDSRSRLVRGEVQYSDAHSGNGCQHLTLVSGQGSKAHVAYPLPEGVIIDELRPSLWLKSNHAGLQLMARVVLPNSPHPHTSKPMSVLVPGTMYRDTGQWQQLEISKFRRGLQQQVRILRSEYETEVNTEAAYIDRLVINAYGGAGVTHVWIDDLQVEGLVPRDALKGITNDKLNVDQVSHDSVLDGPKFIRAIEHNGEPFAWFKERGFNTIVLSSPATQSQMQQAHRDGVYLIAPPPNLDTASLTELHNVVIQWRLPEEMLTDLTAVKAYLAKLHNSDPYLRPCLAVVDGRFPSQLLWPLSRVCDVISDSTPVYACNRDLAAQTEYRLQRAAMTRPDVQRLLTLPMDEPLAFAQQVKVLSPNVLPTIMPDPDTFRRAVLAALAVRNCGVFIRSRQPLDTSSRKARKIATLVELLNLDLELIEPWLTGVGSIRTINTDHPEIRGLHLEAGRAHLALFFQQSRYDQLACPALPEDRPVTGEISISLTLPAYRIHSDGMSKITTTRRAGGLVFSLEEPQPVEFVVLTHEPEATAHIMKLTESQRHRRSHLRYNAYAVHYESTRRVLSWLIENRHLSADASTRLNLASEQLQAANIAVQAEQSSLAARALNSAARHLASLRSDIWLRAHASLNHATTSPACMTFETLPIHHLLGQKLSGVSWSGNRLVGSEFDDLASLIEAGWRQQSSSVDVGGTPARQVSAGKPATYVEVSPAAARTGGGGLRVVLSGGTSGNLVRVVSPAVQLPDNALIRVDAWVKVMGSPETKPVTVTCQDSFGGNDLAITAIPDPEWQQITFYRAASADNTSVEFEFAGSGEVWLDDVRLTVLEVPVD